MHRPRTAFALFALIPATIAAGQSSPAPPAEQQGGTQPSQGQNDLLGRTAPPVPGALPPGLYRAGAIPLPPPAFYDPSIYYYGGGYGGYDPRTCGPAIAPFGRYYPGRILASPERERAYARIPYETALRDAQRYHYLNQYIRRDEQLQAQSLSMTDAGTASFRAGLYERAAVTLLDASSANHGDALSRIRAGHALFALGRYEPAVRLIRRAFELQPRLATLGYDIRDDYGRRAEFETHRARLERYVERHPQSAAAAAMLGYVRYFTTGPGSAYTVLAQAKALDPRNELIDKLLRISAAVYSPPEEESPQPARERTPAAPTRPLLLTHATP